MMLTYDNTMVMYKQPKQPCKLSKAIDNTVVEAESVRRVIGVLNSLDSIKRKELIVCTGLNKTTIDRVVSKLLIKGSIITEFVRNGKVRSKLIRLNRGED